jgi:hypothetical protein
MNRNLDLNSIFRRAGIILLLLVSIWVSAGAAMPFQDTQSTNSPAVSSHLDFQTDTRLSDEDKIEATIDAYFKLRYEGQRLLEAQDFSELVEDAKQPWVERETDKRDIELYIASLFGLNYVRYNYTLDYDTIEIKDNEAYVLLRESHEVVFESAAPFGIVSKLGNLQHTFTLHKVGGVWLIANDEYQDEISLALDNQTKEELIKQVDENYRESLEQSESTVRESLERFSVQPLALSTYPYNRTRAKNYADTYWNTTNPPYYVGLSSDCANFVSQAIYAGEGKTPPDTSGMPPAPRSYDYDWYYVWNNSGSKPWINVSSQYSFITGNIGRIGPYGSGTTNYCDTQVGDVVQLKDATTWFHEAIISVIAYPCGGKQFYYVDAHTTNRYQYPLINWSLYTMRFIRINGWRGN